MSTALLSLMSFCQAVSVGSFGPLLPEIAKAQRLADWRIGILSGAFGVARTVLDIPAGRLASRRLRVTLVAGPLLLLAGVPLLGSAGPFEVLVLGRFLIGAGHAFGLVGGLTALLQRPQGAAFRLNVFDFAAVLGLLAGVTLVGLLPAAWSWNRSLMVACSPQLVVVALLPVFWRRFRPDKERAAASAASAREGTEAAAAWPPIARGMVAVGTVMAFAWSSASQFLMPLRGTREFGLNRAANSRLLAIPHVVDLVALLPVGWLADRLGRLPVLGAVCVALGVGTMFVGLGSFPLFVLGSGLFGLGLAGWMLPIGVIRERAPAGGFGSRTGVYRVGVDAGIFLGPLVSGFLGNTGAAYLAAIVGLGTLLTGARLLIRIERHPY
jgi:MFS family permease